MNIIQPLETPPSPLRAIPPLTALLAFERAASQLSFRRAARDLSLSPSAISHQIRGLEEQFGTKLFVRGARSVRPMASVISQKSRPRWRRCKMPAATCCGIAAMPTPNSGSVRCRSSPQPC
jgi:hypothetical protein